jgi:hypothetical protein
MSIRIMSRVWAEAPYAGSRLLVLLALADWANEEGICWPSLLTIANKTRLGSRQVNNILRRLLADQAISIEKAGGGRGVVNHYRMNLGRDSLQSSTPNHNSTNRTSLKSATETMKPCSKKPVLSVGAIRKNHHEPLRKPSKDVHPSVEDIHNYCLERGNAVDPQQFFDYYTSNGWKVGRVPMKDWRAAVRTWERNGVNHKNGNKKRTKRDEVNDSLADAVGGIAEFCEAKGIPY